MAADLSRISRGRKVSPPLALVYGPEGCGKTSFLAGAPDVLFLRAENGIGTLDVARFPADDAETGPVFRSFDEVIDALRAVHAAPLGEFQSVVLDSISAVERLIHEHVCRENQVDSIEKVGGGYGKGYTEATNLFAVLVQWLQAVHATGRAVFAAAHADVDRFANPEGEDYDEYRPRVHKKARGVLLAEMDHVLFMNWQTFVSTAQGDFGKKSTTATGARRMLYTAKRPAAYAKNRYGLPAEIELPDDPSNPTAGFQTFSDAIAASVAPAS